MTDKPTRQSALQADSWALHPAEVAVLDGNAEAQGTPAIQLMAAAGEALAQCAAALLRKQQGRRVCLLCGAGNNGGDGYAAALHLCEWGYRVYIVSSAVRQRSAEAQHFRQRCWARQMQAADGQMIILRAEGVQSVSSDEQLGQQLQKQLRQRIFEAELLIDCLLGAGLQWRLSAQGPPELPPLRGSVAEILSCCAAWQRRAKENAGQHGGESFPPVLACDLPSGLGLESSLEHRPKPLLWAEVTLTFHAPKLHLYRAGHDLSDKPSLRPEVGVLEVAPLPWGCEATDCGPGDLLRLPALQKLARKGDRGRLLVVGGSAAYHGAPLLAAQAAARSGCDLVHLAVPAAAMRSAWPLHLIAEQLPAASEYIDQSATDYLLERCSQLHFDAVLLGPGLGRNTHTQSAVWQLIQGLIATDTPLLLDADALYVLAQESPGRWPSVQGKPMIGLLTPHRGELQRWLGAAGLVPAQVLDALAVPETSIDNPLWRRRAWHLAEQQVIVCTGSTDQLTGRGRRRACARGGHPRLAAAGTGDILAGICASLLAQGVSPWAGARLATYLLRQAGTLAATDYGLGLVADDLPPYIAKVLAKVLAKV